MPAPAPTELPLADTSTVQMAGEAVTPPLVPPQEPPVVPTLAAPEASTDAEKAPPEVPAEVDKAVADAGLDHDKLQSEFAETGSLTDDSFAALEKAGYPRGLVEVHLAGLKAIAAETTRAAYEVAGGAESYNAMTAWASQNADADTREAFDKAVTVGTPAERKQAIVAMKASYAAAAGLGPQLHMGGEGGAPAGVVPFQSQAEVSQAMRDPRYKSDPAYRVALEARLAVSSY